MHANSAAANEPKLFPLIITGGTERDITTKSELTLQVFNIEFKFDYANNLFYLTILARLYENLQYKYFCGRSTVGYIHLQLSLLVDGVKLI